MHWLQGALGVAGVIAGWRWVIRPVRRGFRELLALLAQVRSSANSAAVLAREIEALSGAVVRLVVAVLDDQAQLRKEHEFLQEKTQELTDMVIDLDADVRRIEKALRRPT